MTSKLRTVIVFTAVSRWLAIAALIVVILPGCTSLYLGWGDKAAAQGNWDKAFENYHDAVDRDPGNEEAQIKLEHARDQAAAMHLRISQQELSAENLTGAIEELQRSLHYREDPAARVLLDQTIAAKRRADAEAEIAAAAGAEAAGDLLTARSAYERAFTLNPDRRDAKQGLDRVNSRFDSAADLAQRAQGALVSGKLDTSERLAQRALDLHPMDQTATSVMGNVRLEREARRAERESQSAVASGDLETAVQQARRAVEARSSPDRVDLLNSVEQKAARHYGSLGDKAYKSHEWDQAVQHYERARTFSANPSAFEEKIRDARHEREVSLALRAQASGDLDAALEHYRRAGEIKPDVSVSQKIEGLEKSVKGSVLSGSEIYEKRVDSVVLIQTRHGLGSGVVVAKGTVLTNAHVLDGSTGYVLNARGQQVPYFRAWKHQFADIAVIQLTGLVAELAPLGEGLDLKPGDRVSVIGNPRGLTFSYSDGSVSQVGRSLDGVTQLIQFTAPISPGSSGGPIFNEHGEVVGLVTLTLTSGQNLNFGVPIEYGIQLMQFIR